MLTMPAKTSEFAAKLNALMVDKTKAEAARAAKISPQQIQGYLDGSGPRPHTALLLARFLDVDPVWFMDEDQPWREDYPRYNYRPGCYLTDDQLLDEVALRFQHRAHWFADMMDRLNSTDWDKVWKVVSALEPGDTLPADLEEIAGLLRMRGHFPHVHPFQFHPRSLLNRKIDQGEIERTDPDSYNFFKLSDITVQQREAHPKLEMTLSRLGALKLLPGKPSISGPDALK